MENGRAVEIRLLGPLEVAADGRPLELGGGRQRALLVVLALRPDDTDTRLRLALLLHASGQRDAALPHLERLARSGSEAIEVWRSWSPGLILMDVRMPVLSGVEATERIRAEERVEGASRPRTAIVALTASAFEHEREEIVAYGCDAFVTKPFRESTVFATLAEQLGLDYVYTTTEAEPPTPEAQPAITAARWRSTRCGSSSA